MNCGCIKNLGCFAPSQTIDFGLVAPCSDEYIFEVYSNGSFQEIAVELETGDPLVLPMTFNENSSTMIKIKVPACAAVPGWSYFTTSDGACCFEINGIVPVC